MVQATQPAILLLHGMFGGADDWRLRWPAPTITGNEKVAGRDCQIIETRPPTNSVASSSAIKVWVAPDIALPLRMEKSGKAGELVKRFRVDRLLQQEDGTWSAAQLIVEPADASRQTVLQGARAERGLDIPAADFTPAKLKESLLNR